MTTSFTEGSYDQVPNSSYPFTPTLGQEFTSRLSTLASQSRGQSESYSNAAQESTSAAVVRFRELRNAYSQGSSFERSVGENNSSSIQKAFSEVDQASQGLQRQYGLSRRAADDITTSWFLNGEAGAGVGGQYGPANFSAGVKGGRNQSWTDSDIGIASEDRGKILGSLKQLSDSRNWSETRDGFIRTVSQSSSSSVSSSASGLSSSLTEAQSYTVEARRAEEIASRLEDQASWFAGRSASGSLNLSQAYREWGLAEMDANRDYYGNARFDDVSFQLGIQGQELQNRFVTYFADQLHQGIEDKLTLPAFDKVDRPSINSASDVRGSSSGAPSPMPAGGGEMEGVVTSIRGSVSSAQESGQERVGRVRGHLQQQTERARGASAEAADEVKEWPDR